MKKILITILTITFIALWILGNKISNSPYYRYEEFQCKNEVFTNKQPMRVYSFRNSDDFQSKMLPYNLDRDDGTPPVGEEHIYILKTYPIGSEFKFKKLYYNYSFGNGGYSDFIVEAEDGLQAWLSSFDVDINECDLDYFYEQNRAISSSAGVEVSLKEDIVKNPAIQYYQAHKDLVSIKSYSENVTSNSPILTLTLPYEKYYHFTKKILEQHATNIHRFKTVIENNKGNELPIFSLNGYTFTPLQCQSDFTDMYACFEHFDHWLSNPYQTDLPIKTSSADEVKSVLYSLQKDTSLVVGYMKNFEYMRYLRFLKGVERIQTHFNSNSNVSSTNSELDSNIFKKKKIMLIVGEKEGLALKEGFNIVDHNFSTIGHYFFLYSELGKNLNSYNLYDQ